MMSLALSTLLQIEFFLKTDCLQCILKLRAQTWRTHDHWQSGRQKHRFPKHRCSWLSTWCRATTSGGSLSAREATILSKEKMTKEKDLLFFIFHTVPAVKIAETPAFSSKIMLEMALNMFNDQIYSQERTH